MNNYNFKYILQSIFRYFLLTCSSVIASSIIYLLFQAVYLSDKDIIIQGLPLMIIHNKTNFLLILIGCGLNYDLIKYRNYNIIDFFDDLLKERMIIAFILIFKLIPVISSSFSLLYIIDFLIWVIIAYKYRRYL